MLLQKKKSRLAGAGAPVLTLAAPMLAHRDPARRLNTTNPKAPIAVNRAAAMGASGKAAFRLLTTDI